MDLNLYGLQAGKKPKIMKIYYAYGIGGPA